MVVEARRNSALVALVALAASATSLRNGFAYDDIAIIATNTKVHELSSWWTLFASSYWPAQYGESLYRPFSTLAYSIQWAVGGGRPLLFHGVSILLFIVLAVAVLVLLRELLAEGGAAVGAALFAAHPVHTEAVANVVGQAELFAALGVVGALTLYLRARRAGGPSLRQGFGIVALYALASIAKEHALLFPLLIGALELTVLRENRDRRHAARLTVVLLLVAAQVLAARAVVLGSVFGEQHPVEMDLSTRVWTMFRVVPEWLRLLVWPAHLSADYAPNQIAIVDGPGVVSLLGIVLLSLWAIAFAFALRKHREVAFGLAWLAITFIPVSNLLSGVVLQERTLMLPSVGASLVFGAAFQWLLRQATTLEARRGLVGVVALLALLGVVRSARRNPVWRDNLTLFTQTVQDAPRSYRAHYVYGSELFNVGRAGEGERELRQAIALSRNDSDPYNFLATKYREAKLYPQAIPLYRTALELRPSRPDSRFGLAFSLLYSGDPVGARAQADTGLASGQLKSYFEFVRQQADSILRVRVP
jgi:protein O-mannosyl-transferase